MNGPKCEAIHKQWEPTERKPQLLLVLVVLDKESGQQPFQQQHMANHVAVEGGEQNGTLKGPKGQLKGWIPQCFVPVLTCTTAMHLAQ